MGTGENSHHQPEGAAIWDLDGLMVDTIPIHHACWAQTLDEHGLRFSDEVVRRLSGCRDREIGAALFAWQLSSYDERWLDEVVTQKQALFAETLAQNICLHRGVREWVQALADGGFAQAIASSTSMRNIELVLTRTGLRQFFRIFLSGEAHVARGKPAPDIFLLASEQLGVHPARCVVLEDSSIGVQAAKAAGMWCVAITNTQPAHELIAADLIADSLCDLSPVVCVRWLVQRSATTSS